MPCKTLHLLLLLQLAFFTTLFSQTNEQLRGNLYVVNDDSTSDLYDGNLTMFNINNSNAVDDMDAVKMTNFSENFGLLRGSTTLVIERRKSITTTDTIFFRMWKMRLKTYKLELLLTGLDHPGLTGILEDNYLHTKTPLKLNGANNSMFVVTNIAASYAADRFRIIFTMPVIAFKLLPITFTGFRAHKTDGDINVEWTVENENDISHYQIQKSGNGQQFFAVATITSKGKNTTPYLWTDKAALPGNNFYRIQSTDVNGKIEYSNVIKVLAGINRNYVSVFPNPVVNGLLNIKITDQPKGIYIARLINYSGQMVHSVKIYHTGGNLVQAIHVSRNIAKGEYTLQIITPDQSSLVKKVVMQ